MTIRSAVITYWLLGLLGLECWKTLALVSSFSCRLSYSVRACGGGNCLYSSSLRSRRDLSRRTWKGYYVSKEHSLAIAVICDRLKCGVSGCDGDIGASLEYRGRKRGLRKWLLRRVMELTAIMAFGIGILHPNSVLAAITGDIRCCVEKVGRSTQHEDDIEPIVCSNHSSVLFVCLLGVILWKWKLSFELLRVNTPNVLMPLPALL